MTAPFVEMKVTKEVTRGAKTVAMPRTTTNKVNTVTCNVSVHYTVVGVDCGGGQLAN